MKAKMHKKDIAWKPKSYKYNMEIDKGNITMCSQEVADYGKTTKVLCFVLKYDLKRRNISVQWPNIFIGHRWRRRIDELLLICKRLS